MELPSGYEQKVSGDASVVAGAGDLAFVLKAVAQAGSLHAFAAAQPGALTMKGRGTVFVIPAGDTQWAVRHCQRGGAVARVLHDRYVRAGTARPVRELLVSAAARERGISTPRVLAAVTYGHGIFYRGDVATELIDGSIDLAGLSLGESQWPDGERVSAWRATGALLRMCFERGLVHHDLNLRNILVQHGSGGVIAHVIDLDRAHLRNEVSAAERQGMLDRFERSRLKLERAANRSVRPEELSALQEGLAA